MFTVPAASREWLSHSRSIWRCALVASVLLGQAAAQDQTDPPSPRKKAGYYLRTEDGKLIPLSELGVDDAELERLIRQKKVIAPPQYSIPSVVLEGKVTGNVAHLNAKISVQLNVSDDRWVSVPIAMHEGKLTDVWRYDGEGEAAFDRNRTNESGTRHWFFRGAGTHELTLPMVVPVREPQHLRHVLRLRLPDAASSRLALDIPAGNIIAEPPKTSGVRTTRTGEGTRLDVWGLGTQFILQWDVRPDVVNSKPLLRSQTDLVANLATDPFSVTAKQTLSMQQGSTTTAEITLPRGFVVKNTEPQQVDPTGRVTKVEDDEDPGKVRLTFAQPLTGSIKLNWSLVATDTDVARRWVFTGFLVKGAQEQTTKLELTPPEGVAVQPIKSVGVQNVRAIRSDQKTTRCRLLSAESEFTVELRDVEPFYTVTPRAVLDFSEDQVRLEARFRVRVLRGSVQELKLTWPGFTEENWKLLPSPPGESLTDWTSSEFPGNDSLTLNLLTRAAGTFEISVGAVRTLAGQDAFPVSLPGIVSETRQPTTLVVSTNPNVEVKLTDSKDTVSAPIPFDDRMTAGFVDTAETLQTRALLVRSDKKQFLANFRTRERLVSATTAFAFDIREDAINVEETVEYQLDFDHIAELRFTVPDGISPSVSLRDGTPLRKISLGNNTGRFALPEPLTGTFGVIIRYRVAYRPTDPTIDIPMILSADSPGGELRVGVKDGAHRRVTPVGKWTPVFSRQLEAEWVADQVLDKLSLSLTSPLENMARKFTVTRALVQSKVSSSIIDGRVSFVIRGQFRRQVLDVPDGTSISAVAWNGMALGPQDWSVDRRVDSGVLTIRQGQTSGAGILTIDFLSPAAPLSWSRKLRPACPTMPGDTVVDDVIWQVILPTGEHLSAYGDASSPCFSWSLGSFGWSRQTTPEFSDLTAWLHKDSGGNSQVVRTVAGNAYTFQIPTLQPHIRISSMDQSFILLFGSGVAFIVAFTLIRFSPRRFAIAIPLAGLIISLLSLKYTPAIKLLAQPALLGLLLAAVANRIDRRRYRRGYGAYSMDASPKTSISIPAGTTALQPPVISTGSSQ